MSIRLYHRIFVFFMAVAVCFMAIAAETPAENLSPKRTLTSEQKDEAEGLKKKIEAEKQRLKEFTDPVDELQNQMKEPKEKLSKLRKAFGKVNTLCDDLIKLSADKRKAGLGKLKDACKDDAFGRNGAAIYKIAEKYIDNTYNYNAVKKDAKKKTQADNYKKAADKANEKLVEVENKATEKLQNKIEKLDREIREKKGELQDKMGNINSFRARLRMLYGYPVNNTALLVAEGNNGGDANAMAWIDEQAKLIEMLSRHGFEELAGKYFDKVEKMPNPYTGKPLSSALKNYLNKVGAKLRIAKAIGSKDMKDKLLMSQEAVKMYNEVLKKMIPGEPMYIDAANDLVGSYFRLAEDMADLAFKDALLYGSKYSPEEPVFPVLDPLLGGDSRKTTTKTAPVIKEYTAADLEKLSPQELNDLGFTRASRFFNHGIMLAAPISPKLNETFMDLIDNYLNYRDEGDKKNEARYLKYLNKFSPRKIKLQHYLESAYAYWPCLYPVNDKSRLEICKKGIEFINENLDDYKSIWPHDKMVYGYWMAINGNMIEPVLEKGEDGQPVPHVIKISKEDRKDMSKADIDEEMMDMVHYPWPSDRIDKIFKWYVIEGKKMLGKPSRNPTKQKMRVRALYYQVKSLIDLAKGQYQQGDKETDATKKEALLKHAKELNDKALKAINNAVSANTPIGPIDEVTRNNIRLKLAVEYYLFQAKREASLSNAAAAAEWAEQAMSEAASVQGSSDSSWSKLGEQYVLFVMDFKKRNDMKEVPDEEKSAQVLATKAQQELMLALKADRVAKTAEAQEHYRKCKYFYFIMFDKVRNLKNKSDRSSILPKALYQMGAASVKTGDYLTAIVANQALVQEFRNDFKDPSQNYDPAKYTEVGNYFDKAISNLRASAYKQMKENGSARDKKNYVDALLLCVKSSANGEDYVQLIVTLENMGQYEQAIEFIDSVSPKNDYYRLIQLMASSIYLTMIKKDVKELRQINEALNPVPDEDGKIPEEAKITDKEKKELEERIPVLKKQIVEYRKQAGKYAEKFIKLHKEALVKWEQEAKDGIKVPEFLKGIRDNEKKNLLQAMMIPITLALESEDWNEVKKMVPAYLKEVETQKNITPEDKQSYREKAAWFGFVAQYRYADYKKDPLDKAVKNLEECANAAKELEKIDKEAKYTSNAAAMIGSAWMSLANREKAAGNTEADQKYRLASVNWFTKAESRIYEELGLAVSMVNTLAGQELWDRAVNVGRKVIDYWGESLFTDKSLYKSGKGADDLKMSSVISDNLAKQFPSSSISSAAGKGDEELVKKLNELITTAKFEDNPEGYKKAVKAALSDAEKKNNKELAKSLTIASNIVDAFGKPSEDVAYLLKIKERKHLAGDAGKPSADQRNMLNRTLLEAAYPDALFRKSITQIIPSPVYLLKQTDIIKKSYTSRKGRVKSAVLMAIIEPNSIKGQSSGDMIFGTKGEPDSGLVAELKKQAEDGKTEAEKAKAKLLLSAIENPLVVTLYGVQDKRGKLKKRSYGRARMAIAAMLEYDKDNPTDEKLPIKDFLINLEKALTLQNTVLYAKKNYARAMVENGDYAEAAKYVNELCKLFPSDWTLSLDLAKVYTSMAKYKKDASGKLALRPYDKETARLYLQGLAQSTGVLRFAPDGSKSWWQSKMMSYENTVSSLEARKKASKEMQEELKDIKIDYFDPTRGTLGKVGMTIKPMDTIGKTVAIDIQRAIYDINNKKPDSYESEELKDAAMEAKKKLLELAKRLKAIGYEQEAIKKIEFKEALEQKMPEDTKKEDVKEKGKEKKEDKPAA